MCANSGDQDDRVLRMTQRPFGSEVVGRSTGWSCDADIVGLYGCEMLVIPEYFDR